MLANALALVMLALGAARANPQYRCVVLKSGGWVVGARFGKLPGNPVPRDFGTLWANGVAYELENLIQAGPPAEVRTATSINDRGQIVGTGRLNGIHVLLRLDPL